MTLNLWGWAQEILVIIWWLSRFFIRFNCGPIIKSRMPHWFAAFTCHHQKNSHSHTLAPNMCLYPHTYQPRRHRSWKRQIWRSFDKKKKKHQRAQKSGKTSINLTLIYRPTCQLKQTKCEILNDPRWLDVFVSADWDHPHPFARIEQKIPMKYFMIWLSGWIPLLVFLNLVQNGRGSERQIQ